MVYSRIVPSIACIVILHAPCVYDSLRQACLARYTGVFISMVILNPNMSQRREGSSWVTGVTRPQQFVSYSTQASEDSYSIQKLKHLPGYLQSFKIIYICVDHALKPYRLR
jgi:hypothetical protein